MVSKRRRAAQRWHLQAILLLLAILLVACGDSSDEANGTDEPLRVHEYKNEAALDLLYPVDWGQVLVQEGLLLFGEEKALTIQEPGATLTVFRQTRAQPVLEDALQHYLDNGPLASGYAPLGELEPTLLEERDALELTVERAAEGDLPAMRSYIIAAKTESDATYIITASAPTEEWDENWRKFRVVINSISFNE